MTYKVRHSAAASCLANCATRDKGASAVSTESTLSGRRLFSRSISSMLYIVHHTISLYIIPVRRISIFSVCPFLSILSRILLSLSLHSTPWFFFRWCSKKKKRKLTILQCACPVYQSSQWLPACERSRTLCSSSPPTLTSRSSIESTHTSIF